MTHARQWMALGILAVAAIAIGGLVAQRLLEPAPSFERAAGPSAVPVEIAPVRRGAIERRRTFSGTLAASASTTIAPKVAGRIAALPLDVSDPIERGQVVATLDAAEFEQAVAEAEASLAVARARLEEAGSATELARLEYEQVQQLFDRDVASNFELDTDRAEYRSARAVELAAKAEVAGAEAALAGARLRLDDTQIRAEWMRGDASRLVAERLADEGDTVSANTPLLTLIELDPIEAIIFATERDYAALAPGQQVTLSTDAFPSRAWTGRVDRIAPVFEQGTRQARIEIRVDNPDQALKPGMFVRVDAVLGRERDATIVPAKSIARRDGRDVVFSVDTETSTATMVPIRRGIEHAGLVQVFADDGPLAPYVVTLGQQLLDERTEVSLPTDQSLAIDEPPTPDPPLGGAGEG